MLYVSQSLLPNSNFKSDARHLHIVVARPVSPNPSKLGTTPLTHLPTLSAPPHMIIAACKTFVLSIRDESTHHAVSGISVGNVGPKYCSEWPSGTMYFRIPRSPLVSAMRFRYADGSALTVSRSWMFGQIILRYPRAALHRRIE